MKACLLKKKKKPKTATEATTLAMTNSDQFCDIWMDEKMTPNFKPKQ